MLYSLADLQKVLGQKVLAQGEACLEKTLVDSPDVMRDGELVTSLVRHPGKKPYRVYVRIQAGSNRRLSIRGECSCSHRGNCKHVAAVLIRALEEANEYERGGSAKAVQTCSEWPAASQPLIKQYLPTVHQRLLYLLSYASEGLLVQSISARQIDDKGFENISEYEPAWAARGTPPRFLLPVDRELLSELNVLPKIRLANNAGVMRLLQGGIGGTLLRRILETGRAYWQDVAHRLVLAQRRPVSLGWRTDRQGNQHLIIQSDPPSERCLMLDSPWYLDPPAGVCGPLQGELTQDLWTLPPVTPDRVIAVEAELAEHNSLDLPPLCEYEVVQLPSSRPVSVIRFDSSKMIRLSFEYHGVCFSGQEHSRFWNEKVYRVDRHWAFERRCSQQLLQAGLQRSISEEACFTLAGGAKEWYLLQSRMLSLLLPPVWRIEYDPAFPYRLSEVQEWTADVAASEESGWFSFGIGILVEGKRIDLLPALIDLIQTSPALFDSLRLAQQDPDQPVIVPLETDQTIAVPMGRIRQLLETLFELYDADSLQLGRLRLNRFQTTRLLDLDTKNYPVAWVGGEALQKMLQHLRDISTVPALAPPSGLNTKLRGYQQHGLNWLQFLREYDLAGILADDMGLGKTVQLLAHLLVEKEQGRAELPSLVVVPTSLLVNWRREAAAYAPDLKVQVLHGPNRHEQFQRVTDMDLLITSYGLLVRDQDLYINQHFHLLILDEAQAIKNPKTQASRIVRHLTVNHRICLTGTPLENHLGELWSLFDFLLPGLLGDQRRFHTMFRLPIEEKGDEQATQRLARRVGPFLLRRTKREVLQELPPKIEIERCVELTGAQRELYEDIRLAMHERVRKEVSERGLARCSIFILDALLKLRQICCDPRLLTMESARGIEESAKLELLMELLPEMIEEGRRILLYSQFTSMLELIEQAVAQIGIQFAKLTGSTRNRAAQIDCFQNGEVPLFLISLKAGGVGLNLTTADTVIHYDPWWNPAVEHQASARAHRIGQQNPVFVYRLLCQGTVEEKIQNMQLRKQMLAESLFEQETESGSQLTEEDLEMLFGSLD